MADRLADRHPEPEAAEFEAEQPARELSGLPKLIISAAAVAVSLYAPYWVVAPQPAQPYRTSFLAVTLAMTLLAYRPLARGRAATDEEPEAGGDNPGPLDWALAALALVALLYPLLVFDDFARRVVRPTGLDVVLVVVAVLLVLEATRRTVIVLFTILRGGAGVLGGGPVLHRRQLRRLRDPLGGRPRPHRHPGRVPGRHRVRVGGGDHGHPGVGGLAGAAPGRLAAPNPGGGVLSAAGIGAILSPSTLGAVDRHRAGTPHPGGRRPPAAPVRGRPGPGPARPHRPLTARPGGG
jgi:hypothetical protein